MTIAVPDLTGAARMLVNYAIALRRRGHEVVVLHGPVPVDGTGRPQTIVDDLTANDVTTRLVSRLRRPLPGLAERELARAADGADTIVGFNQRDRATAVRAGARLGIPSVLAIQNQHRFWGPGPVPALKRRYYRNTIRRSATLSVCTSAAVEDELVHMGVADDRCVVLPNGIEIGRRRPEGERDDLRRSLGLAPDERVFVNVGRLDVQKAQDLLIEAWAGAGAGDRGGRLLFVGSTTEGAQAAASQAFRDDLVRRVDVLGVGASIDFLGWRSDVGRLLGAADVYIHPARWEGWPLAVLEGMAAGLPVIMTDCTGTPDGHDPANHGPVLATGDVGALTAAIDDFLDRPDDELRPMGAACRRLVEDRYDIDRIGDRFVDLVEGVLSDGTTVAAR
ncbi:MAG: glycosyltransferase family 4 protein [Actinomycetota bacterium]